MFWLLEEIREYAGVRVSLHNVPRLVEKRPSPATIPTRCPDPRERQQPEERWPRVHVLRPARRKAAFQLGLGLVESPEFGEHPAERYAHRAGLTAPVGNKSLHQRASFARERLGLIQASLVRGDHRKQVQRTDPPQGLIGCNHRNGFIQRLPCRRDVSRQVRTLPQGHLYQGASSTGCLVRIPAPPSGQRPRPCS